MPGHRFTLEMRPWHEEEARAAQAKTLAEHEYAAFKRGLEEGSRT